MNIKFKLLSLELLIICLIVILFLTLQKGIVYSNNMSINLPLEIARYKSLHNNVYSFSNPNDFISVVNVSLSSSSNISFLKYFDLSFNNKSVLKIVNGSIYSSSVYHYLKPNDVISISVETQADETCMKNTSISLSLTVTFKIISDTNNDDTVNVLDIINVAKYLRTENEIADLDKNGIVNVLDLILVGKYLGK